MGILLNCLSGVENLSPYLYLAIHDALLATDENARDYPWIYEDLKKVERNLSRLQGFDEFVALRALGLYRVATDAVPWSKEETGKPTDGELEFLSKFVVEGDTWRTFVSFYEAWTKEKPHTIEGLLDYLPEWKRPPKDPKELFGDAEREESFLEDKIDLIGKKLLSVSEVLEQTGQTPPSKDFDELNGGKTDDSLENKIDSIRTSLEENIEFSKTRLLVTDFILCTHPISTKGPT